jgi:hypothetical protein
MDPRDGIKAGHQMLPDINANGHKMAGTYNSKDAYRHKGAGLWKTFSAF